MPRRALHRLARDIRARPPGEPVAEAFLNASRAKQVSVDELTLQRLGMDIYLRDRDPWMRIMALLDADTVEILSGAIAERLRLTGGDAAMAQLLAKVILCVIHEVPPAFDRTEGGDSTIGDLRARMASLAALLAPATAIDTV